MSSKKYDKLIRKGLEAFDDNNIDEALMYYEQAFEIGYRMQDILRVFYTYMNLERYVKAEAVLNKAIECHDDDLIMIAYGHLYKETNRVDLAIEAFNKIKDTDTHTQVLYDLGSLYLIKAENNNEDFNGKNMQQAVLYYEKFLKVEHDDFWGHIDVGTIYEHFNHDKDALKHFLAAYEIDSDNTLVCYDLGVAYEKLGDHNKSLHYYLEAINKEDAYEYAYFNLGVLYKDIFHDYEKAKQYYLMGLDKYPDNYSIWYNLGCIHALLKDYENAYQCFKYLYYKKKEYLDMIDQDTELQDFIKSDYYQKLKS